MEILPAEMIDVSDDVVTLEVCLNPEELNPDKLIFEVRHFPKIMFQDLLDEEYITLRLIVEAGRSSIEVSKGEEHKAFISIRKYLKTKWEELANSSFFKTDDDELPLL